MAKRQPLSFSTEDLQILARERYEHPDPRVQQRLEVLWLISQKITHREAARLAGVSRATAERYVALYRSGGVAALRHFDWVRKRGSGKGVRKRGQTPFTSQGTIREEEWYKNPGALLQDSRCR